MNLNVYNWMIDTDFFWRVLKILGSVLLALAIMILYVYLKVRQNDSGDSEDTFDSPLENIMKIESGESIRKEP